MATPSDLSGMGMSFGLSRQIGNENDTVTGQGASFASATPVVGGNRHLLITASNTGAGLAMPAVGSDFPAARRGDMMMFTNILSASAILYFANTILGSVTTIYVDGGSVVGTTGVSVASAKPLLLRPISLSTWIGLRSA